MNGKKLSWLQERIVNDIAEIPQIKRGKVWCYNCGREESVNGASCITSGWPKCCGYTMSIDSPEERAARKAKP